MGVYAFRNNETSHRVIRRALLQSEKVMVPLPFFILCIGIPAKDLHKKSLEILPGKFRASFARGILDTLIRFAQKKPGPYHQIFKVPVSYFCFVSMGARQAIVDRALHRLIRPLVIKNCAISRG
jgi:hypothetical protein